MKTHTKRYILLILAFLSINIIVIFLSGVAYFQNVDYTFDITSNVSEQIQIFQAHSTESFKEENSVFYSNISDTMPVNVKSSLNKDKNYIRIDFNESEKSISEITDFRLTKGKNEHNIMGEIGQSIILHNCNIEKLDNEFIITTNGNDPYIVINIDNALMSSVIKDSYASFIPMVLILCVIVNFIAFLGYNFAKKSPFLKVILKNYKLIWDLAKNDMKTKYAGSFFGVIWAFIQPVVTVLLYWFVFQVGLRSGDVGDVPFVLWLMCGLIPWFFFQDSINAITNCMIEYSYLVKKMVFQIDILPIVKMLSSLFIHIFFIVFMLFIFCIMGYLPTIAALQILYYTFCIIVLVLGIGYTTSVLVIFFKDLGQIIQIVLQIGMWMTPILWNIQMLPERFLWIMKLNPMYYIVNGFREALIDKVWFWNQFDLMLNFWFITIIIYALGIHIFEKLRPHLADVL